ncbi:hypothetical protein [Ferruginibacter sp. HRS2-29]|uniref:hypothetical protein n=1 Tax=Ferruginibacter sp. HRS2-29 TaxID=2487334 RepID=UPI0020CC936C|nr:hypothetical protein [Ferruginibacter sp. HRS2-29]MCP9749496.1 hypothetical protein [Ferruginibacter sp. HRS2-29]
MNNFRWNPYVLLEGKDVKDCFSQHFTSKSKVLIIMSKGFDIRMNITLTELLHNNSDLDITCLLITFDEGSDSFSHNYKTMVDENIAELNSLLPPDKIIIKQIQLWQQAGRSKRRVGDRKAAKIIDDIDISNYTDIIVDISALPRGIYFSMIGKLLTLIDSDIKYAKTNLLITVAENPALDKATKDETPDEELNFLHGFGGEIDRSSTDSFEPLIWMPILGEEKLPHIQKAYSYLAPNETCPIFPFPSRDPRRPDSLMIQYHSLLFDEIGVEKQNIMYVPEQNPFEAYMILSTAIQNYKKSLKEIGECKAVLSTFSSKLLSIGTLMAAYELKVKDIGVGVLNVDSHGYKLDENINLADMKKESKLFVIWLAGEPYQQ